jgi:hypothetical protein
MQKGYFPYTPIQGYARSFFNTFIKQNIKNKTRNTQQKKTLGQGTSLELPVWAKVLPFSC